MTAKGTDKYGVNQYLNDDGFWHIPCPKCLKNRIINDRKNAAQVIKLNRLCMSCTKTGATHTIIRSDRKYNYDLYYVSPGVWNVPCPKCLKDRIINDINNVRKTLDKNTLCKSCRQTGKLRKPDRKKRRNQQTWALKVKDIYDNKCAVCFSTDSLHAHHILPVVAYPELFNVISNGVCLCENCHKEFHFLNGLHQIK